MSETGPPDYELLPDPDEPDPDEPELDELEDPLDELLLSEPLSDPLSEDDELESPELLLDEEALALPPSVPDFFA